MTRFEPKPGEQRNLLTFIKEVADASPRRIVVICECGTIKEIALTGWKQGLTRSCGCISAQGRKADVKPGDKRNRLTFLEELPKRSNARYALFRCDCGEVTEVGLRDWLVDHTKSCGCLRDVKSYGERTEDPDRTCTKCGLTKPATTFRFRPERHNYSSWCRKCERLQNRLSYDAKSPPSYRRARTADEAARMRRNGKLKNRYGITVDDYDKMFAEQDGKCWTCQRTDLTGKPLHIDHSHETGTVRGLLCQSCNQALGYVNDDVSILERMIAYVSK